MVIGVLDNDSKNPDDYPAKSSTNPGKGRTAMRALKELDRCTR